MPGENPLWETAFISHTLIPTTNWSVLLLYKLLNKLQGANSKIHVKFSAIRERYRAYGILHQKVHSLLFSYVQVQGILERMIQQLTHIFQD